MDETRLVDAEARLLTDVIVVGAGLAGLSAGLHLQRQQNLAVHYGMGLAG